MKSKNIIFCILIVLFSAGSFTAGYFVGNNKSEEPYGKVQKIEDKDSDNSQESKDEPYEISYEEAIEACSSKEIEKKLSGKIGDIYKLYDQQYTKDELPENTYDNLINNVKAFDKDGNKLVKVYFKGWKKDEAGEGILSSCIVSSNGKEPTVHYFRSHYSGGYVNLINTTSDTVYDKYNHKVSKFKYGYDGF